MISASKMIWYTKAIRDFDRTGSCGLLAVVWRCPECGYFPGSSNLPHKVCQNCKEVLEVSEDGLGVTKVKVNPTAYGFEPAFWRFQ